MHHPPTLSLSARISARRSRYCAWPRASALCCSRTFSYSRRASSLRRTSCGQVHRESSKYRIASACDRAGVQRALLSCMPPLGKPPARLPACLSRCLTHPPAPPPTCVPSASRSPTTASCSRFSFSRAWRAGRQCSGFRTRQESSGSHRLSCHPSCNCGKAAPAAVVCGGWLRTTHWLAHGAPSIQAVPPACT